METSRNRRRTQVLRAILKHRKPITRERLAELVGIHQNKINWRVSELIARGYLMEHGSEPTTSGRPAKLLHLTAIATRSES